MSESERITRRRNIMIFNNFQNRAAFKLDSVGSYDIYNSLRVGAVENGVVVVETEPRPVPHDYSLVTELLRNLNLILS